MATLKEKMAKGPVFGLAVFTGAPCIIETAGHWGFDFVYLDLEHCSISIGPEIERQIMAARLSGVSPIVRVTGVNDVEIRKVLEMGAEGVAIPHIRTRGDIEESVRAAKFPPQGRRGAESSVRAAGFGGPDFSWQEYIARSNAETLVIPMAEDYEFSDNIDEILAVPGIDAVNFGPIDYSLSKNLPVGYGMSGEVATAFETLVSKARPKGIGVMCPVVPASAESVNAAIGKGINMLILGNDMYHFHNACRSLVRDCIEPVKNNLKR